MRSRGGFVEGACDVARVVAGLVVAFVGALGRFSFGALVLMPALLLGFVLVLVLVLVLAVELDVSGSVVAALVEVPVVVEVVVPVSSSVLVPGSPEVVGTPEVVGDGAVVEPPGSPDEPVSPAVSKPGVRPQARGRRARVTSSGRMIPAHDNPRRGRAGSDGCARGEAETGGDSRSVMTACLRVRSG